MKEKEAKKCPMEKNGLGDPLPSKNDCKGEQPKMTFAAGAPVESNQDSMTVGPRGPMLLQDVWFLEKLAHFDREVIPERRMHAKGSGAHGVFTVTHDISKYSKAKIFSEIGKKTEMFARFSTVAGERGAADAERDIRRRQLGHGRQQHPGILLPRSAQIPGSEPCSQARPAHQHAQPQHQLGLLEFPARGTAPGHHHHE